MAQLSFPTSALLAAFPFKPRHISFDVYDIEAQKQYVVIAAATGLSALSELTDAGSGMTFGSPVALTVGGANADGVGTDAARNDHKHALPAFGSGAGAFCEGNDSRLSDARTPTAHKASHQSGGSDAIKLDDLAAPDDNTDLNASTSAHGLLKKLPNDSALFLNGAGSFVNPGVGGVNVWYPDAPPASPETEDDEFTSGGSIDAKWTDWDESSSMATTIDTDRRMLKMVQTGNGSVRFAGLFQPIPDTEFAAYCKVHVVGVVGTSGLGAGLMVADDLSGSPGTADFRTCELSLASSGSVFQVIARTWSAYNGTASAATSRAIQTCYLRMRANGTAVASDYSIDGVQWTQIVSVTAGFTPSYYGLCFTTVDNANEVTAYFDFFRSFSGAGTSAYNGSSIGRFL